MLMAQDLCFSFRRPALEGVSFNLGQGQLVGLIGPNGSGKTTLLRMMRNRLQPDRGEVRLKGKPIQRYSRKELARTIGYVLQDHGVGFPLTVLEYTLQARFAFANAFSFESAQDILAAEQALRLTNTWEFRDRLVDELSGGERQRVVLARALAGEPEVLLLDEPTANMDLVFQVEMLSLIKQLTVKKGVLCVFVTHELNLASEFADRILMLRRGRLLAQGPPREVITKENLRAVFDCQFQVDANPLSGAPRISLAGIPGGNG
jgi:iron complex transport system ATP-binding protein